nr:uncharacterized protein LOC131277448 [Dasypus novemcinctus]
MASTGSAGAHADPNTPAPPRARGPRERARRPRGVAQARITQDRRHQRGDVRQSQAEGDSTREQFRPLQTRQRRDTRRKTRDLSQTHSRGDGRRAGWPPPCSGGLSQAARDHRAAPPVASRCCSVTVPASREYALQRAGGRARPRDTHRAKAVGLWGNWGRGYWGVPCASAPRSRRRLTAGERGSRRLGLGSPAWAPAGCLGSPRTAARGRVPDPRESQTPLEAGVSGVCGQARK